MSAIGVIRSFLNKKGGLILTGVSIGCQVVSLVMMYNAAPKAKKAIAEAENEKWLEFSKSHEPAEASDYEPLTVGEKIGVALPYLAGPIGVGAAGCICSAASYGFSAKIIANAVEAANSAITAKEIVLKTLEAEESPEKFAKIQKKIADQNVQQKMIELPKDVADDGLYSFIEPVSGQIFRATTEIIRQGCLDFNDAMMNQDKASLSDLMMCWTNKGAKGLVLSASTDTFFWKADHEKDWLKINMFSPVSNDYGNPVSYIHYNREPKKL